MDAGISLEELQLASRNHALPIEALRYDLTPVGLHYLLIHYDIPAVDPGAWALTVQGAVARPLRLGLGDLARFERVEVTVTMECAGNGRALLDPRPVSQPWLLGAVGTACWSGVRLSDVLDAAGIEHPALEAVFTGLDRGVEGGVEQSYQRSLPLSEARRPEVILADRMNGEPLLPQHGAPLRLVVPGWYGMTHVKWLDSITLVTEPFDGYQQRRAYRRWLAEDDPGEAVTRIQPRSLMIPPGIPEFLTRRRVMEAGTVQLEGRAWSGFDPVARVEVSTDGGLTWREADLDPGPDDYAWCGWSYQWEAAPGSWILLSRAFDAGGRSQPIDPVWNRGGYEVNAVQRVEVEVR